MIGKKVIVRSKSAGVYYGTLVEKNKKSVRMKNARKLFYWAGAAAIEQLSLEGVKNPEDCKFTVVVSEMEVNYFCQIIPCTPMAIANIEAVKEWKM